MSSGSSTNSRRHHHDDDHDEHCRSTTLNKPMISSLSSVSPSLVSSSLTSSNSALQEAWKTTRQNSRQLQLWIKHSVVVPATTAAATIVTSSSATCNRHGRSSSSNYKNNATTSTTTTNTNVATRTPVKSRSHKKNNNNATTFNSTPLSAIPVGLDTTTSTGTSARARGMETNNEKDDDVEMFTVHTIDDALAALSGYREEFPEVDEYDYDYDWILDGHATWYEQYYTTRTEELLKSLHNVQDDDRLASLWNPKDDDDDNKNNLSDDLFILQWGSRMGQQEYQFASFDWDKIDDINQKDGIEIMNDDNDKDTTTFCKLSSSSSLLLDVSADDPFMKSQPKAMMKNAEKTKHIDYNDMKDAHFGDFQGAYSNDNWNDTVAMTTKNDDDFDKNDNVDNDNDNDNDNDDDDDFGDFQQAAKATTTTTTTMEATNPNQKDTDRSMLVPVQSKDVDPNNNQNIDHTVTVAMTPAQYAIERTPYPQDGERTDETKTMATRTRTTATTTMVTTAPPMSQEMDRTPPTGMTLDHSQSKEEMNDVHLSIEDHYCNEEQIFEKEDDNNNDEMEQQQEKSFDYVHDNNEVSVPNTQHCPMVVVTENESDHVVDQDEESQTTPPQIKKESFEQALHDETNKASSTLEVDTDYDNSDDHDHIEPQSPTNSMEVVTATIGAAIDQQDDTHTPQPSIYNYHTPTKDSKTEPQTPTTNNYSQQKATPSSMTMIRRQPSWRRNSTGSDESSMDCRRQYSNEKKQHDNDISKEHDTLQLNYQEDNSANSTRNSQQWQEAEDDDEAESLQTDPSSTGVPSVVQLFSKNPPSRRGSLVVVPSTVRLTSHTTLEEETPTTAGAVDETPSPPLPQTNTDTDIDAKVPLRSTQDNSPFCSKTTTSMMASPLATPSPHQQYHQNLARPLRLSLQLDRQSSMASQSTSSLASPEGRFLRRTSQMRQMRLPGEKNKLDGMDEYADGHSDNYDDNDDDRSQGDTASFGSLRSLLPDRYLWKSSQPTPSQDVMHQMITNLLKGLEWDWIPYWQMDTLLDSKCDSSFVPLWLEQITDQLSELDAAHLKISKRLYKIIQPHAGELEVANRMALDLEKNLQLCRMYLQRSQTSIQLARYGETKEDPEEETKKSLGGIVGAKRLLNLWDTQESYTDLDGILNQIANLYQTEEDIRQRIEAYDIRMHHSVAECEDILKSIEQLHNRLSTPTVSRIDCLQDLQGRVKELRPKDMIERLHSWIESTAARCCHATMVEHGGLEPNEYGRLVEAVLLTEQQDSDAIAKDFTTTLHTALLLEAQKSFGMALLNPTGADIDDESEYDTELLTLSTKAYLDPSKMRIWTYNLVTIRFDFELSRNLLPAIYHKLCWLVTNVLHAHHCLLRWHKESASGFFDKDKNAGVMSGIYDELLTRRASVWNSCIKVLEECLEEYIKYYGKKKLFQTTSEGQLDDSAWFEDLMGLSDVAGLTNQFLSLRSEFLDGVLEQFINDGSMLREKLVDIQKKHLRTLHVEAMNKMGLQLYREDWSLVQLSKTDEENGMNLIRKTIVRELESMEGRNCSKKRTSESNRFALIGTADSKHLDLFLEVGNPFDEVQSNQAMDENFHSTLNGGSSLDASAASLLQSYIGSSPASWPLIPGCIMNGFFQWFSRTMLLFKMLPSTAPDACEVIIHLSNLYITTAFRLCCGSSKNEKILLGVETPKQTLDPESVVTARSHGNSSPMFGFGRRSPSPSKPSTSTNNTTLPSFTDAEICSPLPCEEKEIQLVRELIVDAQEQLKSIAKLDLVDGWITDANPAESRTLADLVCQSARVLEKRQAALWGCGFLTIALQQIGEFVSKPSYQKSETKLLGEYTNRLVAAMPKLLEISNRISCVRAFRGRVIVQQILRVGSGWEEAKLHGHPNQYVESVCEYAALLWCSLHKAGNIPLGAIELVWKFVVEGGFASLLDGFSRIPFCSTEGRALMSMDLATFTSEMRSRAVQERLEDHASTPDPPMVSTDRGMAYVDTYIKIFYFPPMDALGWIKENYKEYRMNHMLALIASAAVASSENRKDSIAKLIQQVKALYLPDTKTGQSTAKIASV